MASPWGIDSPALLSRQGDLPGWLTLLQDQEGDLLDLDFSFEELPLVSSTPHVAGAQVPHHVLPPDDVGATEPPAQSAPTASELRRWRCLTCAGACR